MSARVAYDVVVPTVGRPSLARLLDALASQDDLEAVAPARILLVDDRRDRRTPDLVPSKGPGSGLLAGLALPAAFRGPIGVLRSGGRGPAAARNVGWRAAGSPWIAFLDDDVVPPADWCRRLVEDLRAADAWTAGVQGRIVVPLPAERRPTDWERNVAGLERARWATADMTYRREALARIGGFDERFTRNYREDADLGLRLTGAGWRIAEGTRTIVHPVGPANAWKSLTAQAGNADDALMRRLHGKDWRERAGAPSGRLPRHAATAAAGIVALAATVAAGRQQRGTGPLRRRRAAAGGRGARPHRTPSLAVRRLRRQRVTTATGLAWALGTAELAWRRIAPGPKTTREIATMLATSAAMPFVATAHRLRGELTRAKPRGAPPQPPAAVLLDRDGTLVADVPYNGDPAKVEPMPGAREALALLRAAEIPVGMVSNQSGIGRGLIHSHQVEAVNDRVQELLGPLWPIAICPHAPAEDCDCRKPKPGLILQAARRLGVRPERCAVIGDIGADMEAARAAGARGILVPTPVTRHEEIEAATEVAPDLPTAVKLLLGDLTPARERAEVSGERVLRRRRVRPETDGLAPPPRPRVEVAA
jgi:HAD superfamily hydrolase (TIGR01662 family)